jgi:hypothetical protein
MFRDETYLLVAKMLERERHPLVLESAISALGHLDNVEAVALILRYMDHPDEDVRFSVAFALGCFPNDDEAVKGLLILSLDPDEDVSDWAVFGLGVQGTSTRPRFVRLCFDHWRTRILTSVTKLSSAWENAATNVSFRYSGRCLMSPN